MAEIIGPKNKKKMRNLLLPIFALLLLSIGCTKEESPLQLTDQALEGSQLHLTIPEPQLVVSEEERIGDLQTSYLNPEFSDDGRFMIWSEQVSDVLPNNDVMVQVWHCGIDPETGNLIPADGRGFKAFESTIYKRPNMGFDQNGPYYVGADRFGRLIKVENLSNTSGTLTNISTPPNLNRRGDFSFRVTEQPQAIRVLV